jgi:hypothetical protein
VKKTFILVLAVAAFAVAGCKEKPQAPAQAPAPQSGAQTGMPADAMHGGGNPHAGIKAADIPAGAARKGTVVTVEQTPQFTYVQVDENGKKVWVAVPKIDVAKGAMVEFLDAPATPNFHSPTLNRTFDTLIMSPVLKVVKK